MKPGLPQPGERRGIHCPGCGQSLNARLVAKSYPSPAGQYRTRACSRCHAMVETSETVIGMEAEVIDISGLSRDQVRLLTQMIGQFRRENVIIEMPHARVPARLMVREHEGAASDR